MPKCQPSKRPERRFPILAPCGRRPEIVELCEISAYHESGHAVMAVLAGAVVRSVTIAPDWDDGPSRYADTQIEWPQEPSANQELAERFVRVALAGPVAEMIHVGEPYHPGFVAEWASDWKSAWDALAPFVPEQRRRLAYLEQTTARLHQMFRKDEYWAAVAAVVDDLIAHETLEGDQVEQIVRYWLG